MRRTLWIADPDAEERRALGWALRDQFALIVELEDESALTRELDRAGPFERVIVGKEIPPGRWRAAALLVGEQRHITLLFRDPALEQLLRRVG